MIGSFFSHTRVSPTDIQSRVRLIDILSTYGVSGLLSAIRRATIIKSRPIRQKFVSFEGYSNTESHEVLWVPTELIEHETTCLTHKQAERFGALYSGPWDKPVSTIRSLPYFRSFEKHFIRAIDWSDTYFYRDQIRRIRDATARVDSKRELEERLSYIDELYERIRNEGYKTQRELLEERPTETRSLNNDAPEPALNEVGVCIGRHGRIIKHVGGTHRLYIAKLLEIDRIPVIVRVRHTEWQTLRDKITAEESDQYCRSNERKYCNHPDLSM